jgi:hypothetical protein
MHQQNLTTEKQHDLIEQKSYLMRTLIVHDKYQN